MRPKLEVFDAGPRAQSDPVVVLDQGALEEERLAAFDKGYAAGWEDAAASQAEDQSRMRADLARHMQSLGFTYHEARAHVLKALAPLLTQIVDRILPEMARESLAPVVLEAVMPVAEDLAEAPLALVLNPAARPAVEALLDRATGFPLTIREEPTLGEGQVYFRLGDSETRVDLDRVVAEISAAVRGFFDLAERDRQHG